MEQKIAGNAARLVGEMFLPGASQYVAGNIGSGVVHSVLAGAAGALLIGSGVAPLVGTLAVIGVKLNSFASATTGHGIGHHGAEVCRNVGSKLGMGSATQPAPATESETH